MFFNKDREGGILDVIRCDEENYLIWKWRPFGDVNSSRKENMIRWGSSLRVKDGEVAVFVYNQKNGPMQEFIEGPYDDVIKTANFPVLSNILGLAFGGNSPFQAEVYFINLSGNIRQPFGIPFFNVSDPRYPDFFAPIRANGSFTFNISNYKNFIKLHRLIDFEPNNFYLGVRDAVNKTVKTLISQAPFIFNIPLVLINQQIESISDLASNKLKNQFVDDFGVNLKRFDLAVIEIDEKSHFYSELRNITANQQSKTIEKQTDISLLNLEETQKVNQENISETLRIQRENAELQSQSNYLAAHQINLQADVLKTASKNLESSSLNSSDINNGLNPVNLMTSLAMGGAIGSQINNMMNNVNNTSNSTNSSVLNTPPPIPIIKYNVLVNGVIEGPFDTNYLKNLFANNQINLTTYVWMPGMANWEVIANIPDLLKVIVDSQNNTAPPPPPPL